MTGFSEDLYTEFKRDWVQGAKRTAVAFANTDGGIIWLGVDDDGHVCGVPDADESMRQATQAISDGIRPDLMPFISVDSEDREGATVVAVHVGRGSNRPYYLADKGIRSAGVYVRSGAASIPASESAIVDMIRTTAGNSYESAVSLEQSLTFHSTENAFHGAGLAFTTASMRTLGMVNADGVFTNLAWLLSDQCTVSIKAAEFSESSKETFLDRQEFSGSLLDQIDQVAAFVNRRNRVISRVEGLKRVDEYAYAPLTLREALLNMIIHRDYALSAPSLVSVFPNRMEFLNPGGLPDTLTRSDMFNGISCQRNPKLANVFYRLHLVEAYGTGIRRILADYADADTQPEFNISDHVFRLVLPRKRLPDEDMHSAQSHSAPAVSQPANDREKKVLDYIAEHDAVTRAEVQSLINVSQATAAKLLRSLIKRGLLVREGSGPSTRYRLAGLGNK
ncbi:transcriptional regulator [Bifidobacterium tissieri]|uniref:Transcriptional regulator n=1 Tax=Bifidobacterium tissieri TaxID=1630162 RepID=A0A261FEF5_9BIFI|nr:RNA-binding domain-containing protein [Bifidobacterium tissieri]OZG57514.1 transcriptional regulator [Bifidobacterium tissieri]